MSTNDIDSLVTDFYQSISFQTGEEPDYRYIESLFISDALLINNSFGKPLTFTPESFVKGLQSGVAAETMQQFMQREIFSKTEIFGKIAQRVSVYEYTFADPGIGKLPKGINFIQCICTESKWHISSMAWHDETENHLIPHEYHIQR